MTPEEREIEFVFLYKTLKPTVRMIKERLESGWRLDAINDDRAYFSREDSNHEIQNRDI